MHFRDWILMEKGWHGLNGVTLTCHGIDRNFGLAIFQIPGKLNALFFVLYFFKDIHIIG